MFYAHRTDHPDKSGWQPLLEHSTGVQRLSGDFAEAFNAREWGEAAGLLHDLGKYDPNFQKRLEGQPIAVDHSTAGAQAIMKHWDKKTGLVLAYIISGHHTGLPDYGSESGDDSCLVRRLRKKLGDYSAGLQEIRIPPRPRTLPIQPGIHPGLQVSLFIRMLFSCLVDADSLDTERFCEPERTAARKTDMSMSSLLERFQTYMDKHFSQPRIPLDVYRRELLQECLEEASEKPGLFTLSMPTGSGKTLTSLGFALNHAVMHGMRRIIYVIPYTSIIEQTACVLRTVLGEDCVLEHHSNIRQDSTNPEDFATMQLKLKLAEENWDFPVVVTTNVQFFESLFSNKRTRCRKLHNIARSVIILDEAQMLNGGYYKPCLYALEELSRNYHCSVLLCTATQPKIAGLYPSTVYVKELNRDVEKRYLQFKRVQIVAKGVCDLKEIAASLSRERQALCIVNTRYTARELYKHFIVDSKEAEHVFHLSARMCAVHRTHQLEIIKARLENRKPCIVVSTQLIEAGVDIDFPVVYRELAGLDSIAQAAGRCNRNGLLPMAYTYVFELPSGLPPGWFSLTGAVARTILDKHRDDPLSPRAIHDYFHELYCYQTAGQKDRTDEKGILNMLNEGVNALAFPFTVIDREFRLIETETRTVIIPYDRQAEQGIEELKHAPYIGNAMRKLQPYTVQIYQPEFEAYRQAREIEEIREGIWVLQDKKRWYDEQFGLLPYSEKHAAQEIYVV